MAKSKITGPPGDGKSVPAVEKTDTLRRIPPKKIAALKSAMKGAEKRIQRRKKAVEKLTTFIERGYQDRVDKKGTVIGQIPLTTAEIDGLRLKRSEIESELLAASGAYFHAQREYRSAVRQNNIITRERNSEMRTENRIRRQAKSLSTKTVALVDDLHRYGGGKESQLLTTLAVDGDTKGFRAEFDRVLENIDPAHYTTISGVSSVKTEIIHAVMDKLAADAKRPAGGNLTDAVKGPKVKK